MYPNGTDEIVRWERLDPHHITPNARQLEVYHLKVNNRICELIYCHCRFYCCNKILQPNTSYQFRIWANNEVGAGEMKFTYARTKPPVEEKGKMNTQTHSTCAYDLSTS